MIALELTQSQAEQLDIVRCACGHRHNNHFQEPDRVLQPCGHCPCEHYEQVVVLPKSKE